MNIYHYEGKNIWNMRGNALFVSPKLQTGQKPIEVDVIHFNKMSGEEFAHTVANTNDVYDIIGPEDELNDVREAYADWVADLDEGIRDAFLPVEQATIFDMYAICAMNSVAVHKPQSRPSI